MFRPTDTSIYGGNQARAIAGQQQQNRQAQAGLADFESQLTRQDIQTKQQGQQQFAQARTKQKQTSAQRDAAIEEAEMQYQAELDKRRKKLGSVVGNLAGTVAGSFLGPAGAAAGGALAGGLTGGGMGAVQGAGAGFTTSFQRQQSEEFMNQLSGNQQAQGQTGMSGEQLAENARQSVDTPQGAQPLGMDFSGIEGDTDFGSKVPLPQQQQTPNVDTPQPNNTVQELVGDFGQYDLREYQQDVGFEGIQEELGVGQQQPMSTQQQIESLRGRDDLSFEEFQRLEQLQRQYASETQRNVMGRIESQPRPSMEDIGNRFGNLFGNVSQNTENILNALGLTQEARYQQYTGQ